MSDRFEAQFAFLREIDGLKTVLRGTPICDNSRRENTAEHSWHIAMFALVFADHAGPGVDIARVVKMLLLHDIVEIDAGDNPIHGQYDAAEQEAKELIAADRLFGLLPDDLARDFRATWDEFEAATTPDAKFAKSLDRLQPLMMNIASGGGSWTDYNVTLEQLDQRVGTKAKPGAAKLWELFRAKALPFFK